MDRSVYSELDSRVRPLIIRIKGKEIFVEKLCVQDIPAACPSFDKFLVDLATHAIPIGHIESDWRNYRELVSRHLDIFWGLACIATGIEKSWIETLTEEEQNLILGGFYLVNMHFLLGYVL